VASGTRRAPDGCPRTPASGRSPRPGGGPGGMPRSAGPGAGGRPMGVPHGRPAGQWWEGSRLSGQLWQVTAVPPGSCAGAWPA